MKTTLLLLGLTAGAIAIVLARTDHNKAEKARRAGL